MRSPGFSIIVHTYNNRTNIGNLSICSIHRNVCKNSQIRRPIHSEKQIFENRFYTPGIWSVVRTGIHLFTGARIRKTLRRRGEGILEILRISSNRDHILQHRYSRDHSSYYKRSRKAGRHLIIHIIRHRYVNMYVANSRNGNCRGDIRPHHIVWGIWSNDICMCLHSSP